MEIKSKIKIFFNDGLAGTANEVVIGRILNVSRTGNAQYIGANYEYFKLVDEVETKIMKGSFELKTKEEIQGLYDLIKDGLPADTDVCAREEMKYYKAMQIRMQATFLPLNEDLSLADLEIIE